MATIAYLLFSHNKKQMKHFNFCPNCAQEWHKDSNDFGCWDCGYKFIPNKSPFITNRVKSERKVFCNEDCTPSGCKSHLFELKINDACGNATLYKDNIAILGIDNSLATALVEMILDLSDD